MKTVHTDPTTVAQRWLRRVFPIWLGLTPTVVLFPLTVWALLVLAGAGGSPILLAVARSMDPSGALWLALLGLPWPLYVGGNIRGRLRWRRTGLYLGWCALFWLTAVLVVLAARTGTGVSITAAIVGFQWWCFTAFMIHYEH